MTKLTAAIVMVVVGMTACRSSPTPRDNEPPRPVVTHDPVLAASLISPPRSVLLSPFLSTVQIKWDNGTTLSHYLYRDPGNLTMVTDYGLTNYDPAGAHAFYTPSDGDSGYTGCGIAVAQSALRYFGINLSRAEVNSRYIPSHKVDIPLVTHDIYVRPTSLKDGLINALYDYAGVGYLQGEGRGVHVVIETGKSSADIARHLAEGYPVIALVNGGEHYVLVVVQIGADQFRVIDSDQGPNGWDGPKTLDLNFSTSSEIAQFFQGDYNYAPGMIIHFDPIKVTPPDMCPAGQKDCSPPRRHCTDKKNYCCGGYGCDQKCARGPHREYCP